MSVKQLGVILAVLLMSLGPVTAQLIQPLSIEPLVPQSGARFGQTLATGDVNGDGWIDIIVGVPFADVAAAAEAGRVDVFFGPDFDAGMASSLQAGTPTPGAHFGATLLAGEVNGDSVVDLIVGVPGANDGAGAVYIFFGGTSLEDQAPLTLQAPAPQAGARFGVSAALGDFNGDGNPDLVVGANRTDVTTMMEGQQEETVAEEAGQAFVFFGPDFAADTAQTLQASTVEAGARFGTAVAAANLNNDAFDDVVVAGDRTDVTMGSTTERNAGEALVFFGGEMFDTTSDVTLRAQDIQQGAAFGRVMVVDDVSGDGIDDLVVSMPLFDLGPNNALPDAGEALVFEGSQQITGTVSADIAIRGPAANFAYFGTSLAVGDLSGDGLGDIIGGAPGLRVAGLDGAGGVFIVSGVPISGTLNPNISLRSPNLEAHAGFGQAVAAADVDRDGLADVIVSAPLEDVGDAPDAGRVYVFSSTAPVGPFIINP